jgi:hypothetical protein
LRNEKKTAAEPTKSTMLRNQTFPGDVFVSLKKTKAKT